MQDPKAQLLHRGDDPARWRRTPGGDLHGVIESHALLLRRVDQHVEHDRCTTHVGHGVLLDHGEDHRRVHLAQAHVGARGGGHAPGVGPAVAVEHRQRPQIDALLVDAEGEHLADGVQVCAAVVVHDTLGLTGRAGGVAQTDGLPFIGWRAVRVRARAFLEQRLVVFLSEQPAAFEQRVVDIDNGRGIVHAPDGIGDGVRILAIGDQQLRLPVLENVGNAARIETVVERVEHRARHRHAEMRFEHCRHVRRHDRHGVARSDSPPRERAGELAAAFVELGVGESKIAVDDRGLFRVNGSGTLQEGDRRQRPVVRLDAIEVPVVDTAVPAPAHGKFRLRPIAREPGRCPRGCLRCSRDPPRCGPSPG